MTDPNEHEHHGPSAENDVPEFVPGELRRLADLAGKVAEVVEWHGSRLIVEVWDGADSGPVAWVEAYPEDSHPTIHFAHPAPASEGAHRV